MVEYCVYWLENGEPMHEVFSSLAAADHQDPAADALEVGGRQGDKDGERRAGQCRECLY